MKYTLYPIPYNKPKFGVSCVAQIPRIIRVYSTDPVGSSHSYCDCQCHCQHSPAHDILYPSKPDSNIISGSDDIETKLSAPLSLSIIK